MERLDAGSGAGRHDGVEVVTWPPGGGCAWESDLPVPGLEIGKGAMKDELVADFGIASPRVRVIPFGINILDGVYERVLEK